MTIKENPWTKKAKKKSPTSASTSAIKKRQLSPFTLGMVAGPLSNARTSKKYRASLPPNPADSSLIERGQKVRLHIQDGGGSSVVEGEAGYVDGLWINVRTATGNMPVYRPAIESIE